MKPHSKHDVAIISNDDLRQLRSDTEKGLNRKGAIITQTDLARMRGSTRIETKEEKAQNKVIHQEQLDQKMAAAKSRKQRMVEMDKERAKKLPPSEFEATKRDNDNGLLSKAQMQIDEEHDDVKHMNQMMLYSKVVTIRDKQLNENKRLEDEWVREQQRLDMMMEIERLKSLKASEERNALRVEAQRRGAAVIVDQIKEREQERLREREILEQEQRQIARQIEVMKEQELKLQEQKLVKNKAMVAEVEVANQIALRKKAEKVAQERDEEMKVVQYNRERDAREEARLAEERRIKEEKELEVTRLRALQEKAADRQAEIDALRAKRAFEEGERQTRAKEKADHEKRIRQGQELEAARKKQFQEREITMAQQAKNERDAFLRVIEQQKLAEEHELRVEEEKQKARRDHAQQIRNQIGFNEQTKKQGRLDYLEEGRRVRQRLEDDRLKVEAIKQRKLGELGDLGIQDKYKAELAKKKIT